MDLNWTPEDSLFRDRVRDRVRDWLADHVPAEARPSGEAAVAFDRAWQRELMAGGWAGISWPKEFGRQGLSLIIESCDTW